MGLLAIVMTLLRLLGDDFVYKLMAAFIVSAFKFQLVCFVLWVKKMFCFYMIDGNFLYNTQYFIAKKAHNYCEPSLVYICNDMWSISY
mgnify:FL=1